MGRKKCQASNMKFDEILLEIGEFGWYQKKQYIMICLVGIISSFHALNMVFLGAKPDYYCKIRQENLPESLSSLNQSMLKEVLIPNNSQCQQYDVNETVSILANVTLLSGLEDFNRSTEDCPHGWFYSQEVYKSTIVSSFDLVCKNEWLRSTSKSLYFVGRLLGAIIFGHLSDRFGRRPCFFIALAMQILAGIGLTVSPNIVTFLILYICQGISQVGVFLVAFTIGNELVAPRFRFITGMGIHMFYSLGFMILAGIAYGISEWRMLELAITLPGLLFISYWWLLPESIRWLLSQGHVDEATKILKKVAKDNKTVLRQETVEKIIESAYSEKPSEKGNTVIDLLRSVPTALLSLNIWLAWAVNAMVYYGLSLNTDNLGGSPYINFCIAGAVELPAFIVILFTLNRIGRKLPLVVLMLTGGITCIISGFISSDHLVLAIVFAMIGKFAITGSYVIIYLVGAEIFPTTVRNAGLGVSSMCARIGGIICPQIIELRSIYPPLPLMVFGLTALVSGLLCILLPETMGRELPQTIQDMGKLKRHDTFLNIEQDVDMKVIDEEKKNLNSDTV